MDINQIQPQTDNKNSEYLIIWQVEQEHIRTRWTIVTFFMSISFAIFGYSFQSSLTHPSVLVIRISGVLIYFFGYIFFLRYYAQTNYLRSYLLQMERTQLTTLDIQSKAKTDRKDFLKRISTPNLMLIFGAIYAIGVVSLWIVGI
ncbi:MAG TPA: hypothetical protein VEP90_26710 [Methylomirabilota bacterium]|nr:hypothetical protein [Methylomirabilota bacterium]